jgi:hypothetical protein
VVAGVSRRDWLAAAGIAIVAVAIAGFLLRDTGDDPAPSDSAEPPSARVMSAATAGDLLRELSRQGWRCYDSLADPIVERCFLDEAAGKDGTASAEVALTYADDYLARASVYASGVQDDGRHLAVAEQAARRIGVVLLDGAGAEVVAQLGDRQEIEIAGRHVYGNRAGSSSIQVVVESASYDGRTLPAPVFPAEAELVRVAEAAGLHCDVGDSSTTCSRSGSVGMTITMSRADGRIGSLSISASNYAVPDDPAVVNLVSGYLVDTGLGRPTASRWVRAHADSAIPVRADLGGLHFRLDGGGRALYLSVGEITN